MVPTLVTPPFGPGASVTIYTATQYGGNVGDKVTITTGPTSTTLDPDQEIGDFVVIAINPNSIVVQCIDVNAAANSAPAVPGTTAFLIADGPFTFTLEIPVPTANQTVNVLSALTSETIPLSSVHRSPASRNSKQNFIFRFLSVSGNNWRYCRVVATGRRLLHLELIKSLRLAPD